LGENTGIYLGSQLSAEKEKVQRESMGGTDEKGET